MPTAGIGATRYRVIGALAFALACQREPQPATVLLFNGTGTSRGDVAAVEALLNASHLAYALANSAQLDAMAPEQLHAYRLLIIPGGNFEEMGSSLSAATAMKIRNSVKNGQNYLGICAGAFFAGDSPYNGLNLTGVRFPFFAAEMRGVRKAPVMIAVAGVQPMEQYWEDGPQLSGWGDVIARFDDGTPAIAQGKFGLGSMLLLGTHPEAPDAWHRGLGFKASGDRARAYATMLIDAALNGKPLPHY